MSGETFGRSCNPARGHQNSKKDDTGAPNSPCKVQVSLTGHGDVGQVLLQDEDVPAHFLDARFTDALKIVGAVDQNAGDEVAQTCEGEEKKQTIKSQEEDI